MQAEKYVMHELYKLEQVALEGYASYNFPKGPSSFTTHFHLEIETDSY